MDNNREILEALCVKDSRYSADAYEFVMSGLYFTQKRLGRKRHVSGEELLEGLRELSVQKFGPLALRVLEHWGVRTTEDFGHIVFNMVEHKLLAREEHDTFECFRDRYDLSEAFTKGYRRQLEKAVRRIK